MSPDIIGGILAIEPALGAPEILSKAWLLSSLRSHAAFTRCAPFGLFIALLIFTSMLDEPSPWLSVVRAVLVAALLAWFWPNYRELRESPATPTSHWFLALVAGLLVFLCWIGLDEDWAVLARTEGFEPVRADGSFHWPLVLGRLATFALVVPVMEELFWRSFLMRWFERHDFQGLSPQQVGLGGFLTTTALFAVEHNRWLAGAIAGAVYAGLYVRSGNLWLAIVAHSVTNGMLGAWVLATGNWQFW